MGLFGWSYPPGAASDPFAPYNQEDWCEVCCKPVDDCICPECPKCGGCGNPACYRPKDINGHGMVLTKEQKASQIAYKNKQKEEDAREAEYCRQMDTDDVP